MTVIKHIFFLKNQICHNYQVWIWHLQIILCQVEVYYEVTIPSSKEFFIIFVNTLLITVVDCGSTEPFYNGYNNTARTKFGSTVLFR